MGVQRESLIKILRRYIGVRFSHQGRNRTTGMDCGGLILVGATEASLSTLEFLGYASFPTDGKFEELLAENTDLLGAFMFPFSFDGTEMLPGDLISFDYGNGEGTRHIALVTGWDGRRYHVIEAQPDFGVCEHALAPPFIRRKVTLKAWRIRGLKDDV